MARAHRGVCQAARRVGKVFGLSTKDGRPSGAGGYGCSQKPMQRAWILSCGTELTLGHLADTNAAWLAQRLTEFGLHVARLATVPDEAAELRAVLLEAAGDCDVLAITGGLGPTDDDMTRAALADVAGQPLELDAASLERIRVFFTLRNRDMPDRNRIQAMIPRSGRAIPNGCGTAPGIAIQLGRARCYALPGVPFEMKAMFNDAVATELRALGGREVLLARHLHCLGRGESDIATEIADILAPGRNPAVGTRADVGIISLRILAAAPTRAAAEKLLDADEREIRARLGTTVFGRDDETLGSVTGELLRAASATLGTAESCTGGLIGALLTDAPGSSRYYAGGVVAYANEVKQRLLGVPEGMLAEHGAVSAPVAAAMATGVRTALGTDYALSVTGIAGPNGGTAEKPVGLVYIGLATPAGVNAYEQRYGPDAPRGVIRTRAARTAVDLLRRELLAIGVAVGLSV